MKSIRFFAVIVLVMVVLVTNTSGKSLSPAAAAAVKETCIMGANCNLPDCLCSDIYPPNQLEVIQIPQMIFLTFDDAITVENYPLYMRIFNSGRLNPNGAPISATFFVPHDYNNYSLTHELYTMGHEIALHSISHNKDVEYWENLDHNGWMREVIDQREQMSTFARIPSEEILGFRSPFLQGGGNIMYEVLGDYYTGIKYDSSRPTANFSPFLWPYTADHDTIQDCQIKPCPTGSYPRFWVTPLLDLFGSNGSPCAFIDTCLPTPTNEQETYDFLMTNFMAHYEATRAPFGIYTHASWLSHADYIETAYLKFLDELLQNPDMYIVSIQKGLDWMQNPQELSSIDQLPSWHRPTIPNSCPISQNCFYEETVAGGERTMNTCGSCPKSYPWIGNHLGLN